MINLGCLLLSLAALTCAVATRPQRADCGPGMYSNGIRPSGPSQGIYQCRRVPGGDPAFDGAGGAPDRTVDLPGWRVGRIYCQPGAARAHDDGKTFGCLP